MNKVLHECFSSIFRIKTYKDSTMPVIEVYKKQSLLTEFNAENTAEKVFSHYVIIAMSSNFS